MNGKGIQECDSPRSHCISAVQRAALALMMLSVALTTWAAPLDDFLKRRAIDKDATSVVITDLASGETIVSHREDAPMLPASILKTLTIASAMSEYPISWKYVTPVYLTGRSKDNRLEGNVVIEAQGDPTINHPALRGKDIIAEIIDALKRRGIKEIAGDVVVDTSYDAGPSHPEGWKNEDKLKAYGAGLYPLNYQGNTDGNRVLSNPAEALRRDLIAGLQYEGIKVDGAEYDSATRSLLLRHESLPLDDIMRSCMMRSDNLFAEALLRLFSQAQGGEPIPAEGARLEEELWSARGLDMQGVQIFDGSGLSRKNRVTANFISQLLTLMSGNVDYASYFPLVGVEGTVKNLLADSPLSGYLALKTGTLNDVMCLAGYKLDDDYMPTHAIVIMLNALPRGRGEARKEAAAFLTDIFNEQE